MQDNYSAAPQMNPPRIISKVQEPEESEEESDPDIPEEDEDEESEDEVQSYKDTSESVEELALDDIGSTFSKIQTCSKETLDIKEEAEEEKMDVCLSVPKPISKVNRSHSNASSFQAFKVPQVI